MQGLSLFNTITSGMFKNNFTQEIFQSSLNVFKEFTNGYNFTTLNKLATKTSDTDPISNTFNYLEQATAALPNQSNNVIKQLLDVEEQFLASFKLNDSNQIITLPNQLSASLEFLASLIKQKNIDSFDNKQNYKTNFILESSRNKSLELIRDLYLHNKSHQESFAIKNFYYRLAKNLGLLGLESSRKDSLIVLDRAHYDNFFTAFKDIFDLVTKDLNADEEKHLAWSFANSYTGENPNTTQITCIKLGLPECHPSTTVIQTLDQSTFPSITEFSATGIHAVGNGLINILVHATSTWLRNKGYGESKISALSLSLAGGVIQAAYIATFPLLLSSFIAQQSNEDEETRKQWEMIQEMRITFAVSLALSTGFQVLNYLSENYLAKRPIFKGLIQSIPMVSTLVNIVNKPIQTTLHTGISFFTSFTGSAAINYFSARKNKSVDRKANQDVEMQQFEPVISSQKTYQFITDRDLGRLRENSTKVMDELKSLIDLFKHTPDLSTEINNILEKYTVEHTLLMDEKHSAACKQHERKDNYNKAMNELGNVFKRMDSMFMEIINNLHETLGYINACQLSDKVYKIKEALTLINQALSLNKSYLSRYNTAAAGEKGEKKGEQRVLDNLRKFNRTTSNNSAARHNINNFFPSLPDLNQKFYPEILPRPKSFDLIKHTFRSS